MSYMLDTYRSVYLERSALIAITASSTFINLRLYVPIKPVSEPPLIGPPGIVPPSLSFFARRRGDGCYKSPKLRLFFKVKEEVGG